MNDLEVFVGWDSREPRTYRTCIESIRAHSPDTDIRPIMQQRMRDAKLYWRPIDKKAATEFSLTRFLVPWLAQPRRKWALFCDGDFAFTTDVQGILDQADSRYAVQVVQHEHRLKETVKMDGQPQHMYPRKWWSALVLWNLEHAGHKGLSLSNVNTLPPSALHRFQWLMDDEIGSLDADWHWLDGYDTPLEGREPRGIHWTLGTPELGRENIEYRNVWDRHAPPAVVK